MLKRLVVKELRESAGLVALAVLGMACVLASLTGFPILPWQQRSEIYQYPFVRDSLPFYFALSAGGLAIALGLKQTAWELGQGTYYFLLHRPVHRQRIFIIKLAVGGMLAMSLSGLLILLYAWWAMTPGHFPAPFYWSMTFPAWKMWIAILTVYLGAFLSGIRPGRWFGSRLVPLAAAISTALMISDASWFWLAVALSLATSLLGVFAIFHYVQQRDY